MLRELQGSKGEIDVLKCKVELNEGLRQKGSNELRAGKGE